MTDATETARKLLKLAAGLPSIYPRYLAYTRYIGATNPAAVTQLAKAYLEAVERIDEYQSLARRLTEERNTWLDRYNNEVGGAFEAKDRAETALAQERAKVAALLGALRDLWDEQNGPPLVMHAAEWQAAYDKARSLMNRADDEGWATAPDTEPA